MRVWVVSILMIVTLFLGCRSASSKSDKADKTAKTEAKPKKKITSSVVQPPPSSRLSPRGPAPAANQPAPKSTFHPVPGNNGRVSVVREDLRFIVIDYGPNKLPPLDQRLNVYRGDQKVGEVKISGPYLGTTVAADITRGSAQYGDIVRPD